MDPAIHPEMGNTRPGDHQAVVTVPFTRSARLLVRRPLLLVGALMVCLQLPSGCRTPGGAGRDSLVGGEALGLTPAASYAVQQSLRKGAGSLTAADLERVTLLHELPAEVTDLDLACLARLPALERLTLNRPRVASSGWAQLSKLPALRTLSLLELDQPVDGYRWIGRLRRLESLHLQSCAGVNDDVMHVVANLSHLRGLSLQAPMVGPDGIAHLVDRTNLRSLGLVGTNFTDQVMAQVVRMPKLTSLALHFTSLSETGLARVGELKALEHLVLNFTPVTEEGLKDLVGKLPHLNRLELDWPWLSDAGLQAVAAQAPLQTFRFMNEYVVSNSVLRVEPLKRDWAYRYR